MHDEARRALEAIVMVADEPADPKLLAQLVELSPAAVEEILGELAAAYEAENRGFQLVKVAGGWRYQSHEDLSPYVERYVLAARPRGCRRPRSRPWRSWRTSSRSPARRSPRSAA